MSDPIKIVLKRGQTAGNAPSVLSFGELAVNTFDGTFFECPDSSINSCSSSTSLSLNIYLYQLSSEPLPIG